MRWLILTAFITALPLSALAQEHAPGVTVEVHTERPPEGTLRRGYLPVPSWVLYVGGGALVLGAAGALTRRMFGARRR